MKWERTQTSLCSTRYMKWSYSHSFKEWTCILIVCRDRSAKCSACRHYVIQCQRAARVHSMQKNQAETKPVLNKLTQPWFIQVAVVSSYSRWISVTVRAKKTSCYSFQYFHWTCVVHSRYLWCYLMWAAMATGKPTFVLTFSVQGRAVYRHGGDRWQPQAFATGE